jgi:hypothetical protein
VLGRLIQTLGSILHAAGRATIARSMAAALVEYVICACVEPLCSLPSFYTLTFFFFFFLLASFLGAMRGHSDAHVRRAVLLALAMTLQTVPLPFLMQDAAAAMFELQAWLPRVAEEDPNDMCRQLGLQCLLMLGRIET